MINPIRAILLFLAMASVASASSYGIDGQITEYQQPGGKKLALRVLGDEYYARTETPDGYTVVFNPADQTYYYARISADGESFESTGIRADDKVPAGIAKHHAITAAAAGKISKARREKFDSERAKRWELRIKGMHAKRNREAGIAPAPGDAAASQQASPAEIEAAPVNGVKIGLTILVQFPDDPNTPAIDPTNFPTDRAKIDRYCNTVGYTEDGNTGSVRDYFSDQSNGLLTYTQAVTEIITLPNPRNYYNYSDYPNNTTLRDSGATGRLVTQEAVALLKNGGFDFNNLTLGSSNRILATNILFAGNDSGVWSEGLWPHRWYMSPSINVGTAQAPRYIYDYEITNVSNAAPVIGTFCHENGHLILGYPDLYDTNSGDGSSEGVGNHCLMGAGNHLNGGRTPGPINLPFKDMVGWANIVDLTANQAVTASLPTTGNVGRRIRKPGTNLEYFVVENRGSGDRWAASSPDKGIMIWHIDEAKSGNSEQQMTAAKHYEVSLEQVDGLFDLENNRDRGDALDLFDASDPDFNDATTPDAKWWNGSDSGIRVHVTSAAGANMNVEFGQLLPANTIAVETPKSGQVFYVGSTVDIKWGANITGNVKIELLKNNILQSVISANEVNDGAYAWAIPAGTAQANDYSVRITSVNNAAYFDDSDGLFEIKSQPTLEDALDSPGLVWVASGNANWFSQTAVTHDGVNAAQSGDISNNQGCSLQTTVNGPCTLSFWWKVSSESGYDYLRFYLDGTEQTGPLARISGLVDWTQKTVSIPAGSHTVKWSYTKDGSLDGNDDTAWLDQVIITNPGANSGTWINTAGGSWTTSGNWQGGTIADGIGNTADFSTLDLAADRTVTLDGARTVGNLTFGDTSPSNNWTLDTGSGGPLTLDVSTGTPTLAVNNRTATLNVVLAGSKGLAKTGAGAINLAGANTFTGGINLNGTGLTTISGTNAAQAWTISSGSFTPGILLGSSGAIGSGSTLNIAPTGSSSSGIQITDSTGTVGAGSSIISTGTGRTNMALGNGNALASNIDVSGNTSNVFQFNIGANATVSGNITLGSTVMSVRPNFGTILSGVSQSTTGTLILSGNITGSSVSAIFGNYSSGGGSFAGKIVLSGNNSGYAGLVETWGGTVSFSSSNNLGTGTLAFGSPTQIGAASSTLLYTGTGDVVANPINFANTTGTNTLIQSGTGLLKFTGAISVPGLAATDVRKSIVLQGSTEGPGEISGAIADATAGTAGQLATSLTKSGTGTWTLSGANTYTGTTTINGGILAIQGSINSSSTATVTTGGTLAGSGTVGRPVTVQSGGTLAPGSAGIGTLTINNTLTLGGTAAIELNKTGTILTNDRVQGLTGVTYGGTLNVTATGAALAAGDTFTLFTSTGYTGSFTSINLPALDTGLTWNTSQLGGNGSVSVVPVTHTLTYNAGANGTLGGSTPQTVNHGTGGSTVTAMPDTGYHFVSWSDGGTANPRTDTNVTADLTVTANFAINTYTLTYTPGTNGTLGGSTPQTVNHGSSGTAVTAVPDSGYSFTNWSDGSTINPRTDANVTGNLTVTANFTATAPGPLPAPWTAGTIGNVTAAVEATHLDGTFNVTGGGAGISGVGDNFYFVSQPWSGDCTITARVASLQNTGSAAKAGVFIRQSTETGSRSAFVGLTPSNGGQWVRRSNTDGLSSTTTSAGKPAPYWVRLTRSGNRITSYLSSNGIGWTQLASVNLNLGGTYNVGFATCSGTSATPNTGVFDNLTVTHSVTAPAGSSTPATLPILGTLTLDEDTVSFNINGEANSTWELQESTDFVTWTPLQTVTLPDGPIQHSEADDRGPKRFFRLRSQP